MPTYSVITIVDGQPTFEKPLNEILADLKAGGALKTLTPLEYHTDRQRRWYKGVALPALTANDENGETETWWDAEVKKLCNGLAYLKKETYFFEDIDGNRHGIGRLTTKGVSKRNMTNFIEEILSQAMIRG
ncbi:hypothetical protein LCGC14_1697440, partial [marine sediment metagenome]